MKYQYKVKNFRVFDEEGVKIDMAPITILTGCNSSGKSSIVKSMLLVNKVLNELSCDGQISNGITLDFTESPNNLLGTFDNIIHRGSSSNNITVEYTLRSLLLNEDIVVSLKFKRHKKLNGGMLDKISISQLDGSVLFDSNNGPEYGYVNVSCCKDLRKSFFRYAFAVNNLLIINDLRNGNCLEEIFERRNRVEYAEFITRTKQEIELYYNSNKEWIDALCSKKVPRGLFSLSKDRHQPITRKRIGVSNEQILKENLLYSSVLEYLCEAKKDDFVSIAKEIAEKGKNSGAYKIALRYIDSVAESFVNSECDKFSEYFKKIYNEFFGNPIALNEQLDWTTYESLSSVDVVGGLAISEESLNDLCGDNSLGDLYNLIKLLAGLTNAEKFSTIYNNESPNWYVSYVEYINLVIKEILSYRLPTQISYIPTSVVNIKRLYSFDEKGDMTELLKDFIMSQPDLCEGGTWGFANKWLKKLNIGKKLSVKALADGTGCDVRIYQENDEKGQLLADYGYGISQLLFLLLRIEIEANRRYPVLNGSSELDYEEDEERELRIKFEKPLTIVLEEPEVHLHPKFQSLIADVLLDAYKCFNFHFIVETHSEYLIRRSQVLVSKMGFENNVDSVENNPFVTYYLPDNSKPYSLGYRKDGKFMESFGTGFYDEASNLAFELL